MGEGMLSEWDKKKNMHTIVCIAWRFALHCCNKQALPECLNLNMLH